MSGLVAAALTAAAVFTGAVTYQLQIRLEEWDYERHVDD